MTEVSPTRKKALPPGELEISHRMAQNKRVIIQIDLPADSFQLTGIDRCLPAQMQTVTQGAGPRREVVGAKSESRPEAMLLDDRRVERPVDKYYRANPSLQKGSADGLGVREVMPPQVLHARVD